MARGPGRPPLKRPPPKTLTLRLPVELKDGIRRLAAASGRSENAEMVYHLERSIELERWGIHVLLRRPGRA